MIKLSKVRRDIVSHNFAFYMSATKNVTIQHTKYKAKHSLAANMDEFDDHSHAIPHFEKLFLFKYSS